MNSKTFKTLTTGAARLLDHKGILSKVGRDVEISSIEKSIISIKKVNKDVSRNMSATAQTIFKRVGFKKHASSQAIFKARIRNGGVFKYYKVSTSRDGISLNNDVVKMKLKKRILKDIQLENGKRKDKQTKKNPDSLSLRLTNSAP